MFRELPLIVLISANFAFSGSIQNLPALPNGAVASAVQVDASGNIYSAGSTAAGAFAAKLSPNGSQIIWWTTLSSAVVGAIALGSDNSLYLTGTASGGFPTTSNAMQPALGYQGQDGEGGQAFVAKLNPAGSVVYATYIGGATQTHGNAIAVDASGNAYVTGATFPAGFPTTPGAVAGDPNENTAFILKLNPTGSTALAAIRGFGGNQIGVDAQGNMYAAGTFSSAPGTETGPLAPTTPGAFQRVTTYLTHLGPVG